MSGWRSAAYRYDANLSTLFRTLPSVQRPAAAAGLGYEAVETWWPFPAAVPSDRDADAFLAALADSGTTLVSLNLAEGDAAAGTAACCRCPQPSRRSPTTSTRPSRSPAGPVAAS